MNLVATREIRAWEKFLDTWGKGAARFPILYRETITDHSLSLNRRFINLQRKETKKKRIHKRKNAATEFSRNHI